MTILKTATLKVSSKDFEFGQLIPAKFTCDGKNINPHIHVDKIPGETNTLVVMMDDPDAASRTWNHWLVWNIPITNDISEDNKLGVTGVNDFRRNIYNGPCHNSGTHRFYFKVYALNTFLTLKPTTKKKKLLSTIKQHVIGKGELIGLYKRP